MKIRKQITIYERFSEFSEEQVDNAISNLCQRQKDALYKYYGGDLHNPVFSEMDKKDGLYLNQVVFISLKKMLQQPGLIQKRSQSIYERFNEFSEEQIDNAISNLSKKQRNALYEYYGKDLHKPVFNEIDKDEAKYITSTVFRILKRRLNNPLKREQSIYEKFKDYDEKIIDGAIFTLSSSQKELLNRYYGEDLHNPVINKDFPKSEMSNIYYIFQKIRNKLSIHSDEPEVSSSNKRVSKENIYMYFSQYSREEIDNAISKLSERQRNALYEYYGSDLVNPRINSNISDKQKDYVKRSVYSALARTLNNTTKTGNDVACSDDNQISRNISPVFVNNDAFYNIIIDLYNGNLLDAINKINYYLKQIGLFNYFEVVLDFIKISIIKKDPHYLDVATFLSKVKNINLYDVMASNIQSFYVSLSDNDLELTSIYMDVICKLDELGTACVIKNNIRNIYELSLQISKRDIKTNRLDSFNEALLKYQETNNKKTNFEKLKELIITNQMSVEEACSKYNIIGDDAIMFKLLISQELYKLYLARNEDALLSSIECTQLKTDEIKRLVNKINGF